MRTFKVIALYCSGQGKKMYRSGNIVPENAWPRGRADELIKRGFLVEVPGDDAVGYTGPADLGRIEVNPPLTPADNPPPAESIDAAPAAHEQLQVEEQDKAPEAPPTPEQDIADGTTTETTDVVDEAEPAPTGEEKKEYADITISQLKEYLQKHNIHYDDQDGKKAWYNLYIAN